jgi:hypothetical protein
VERRSALELDRLVLVVREDEDRSVVRRLVAPPAAPVLEPRTANRSEHVAAHHVRAAWAQEQVARAGVRVVQRLVEMPVMELDAAAAEGMLEALVRPGDEAVERDRHMARGCTHVRVDGAATQKSSNAPWVVAP